jgi:hypothetical protein
LPYPVLVTAVNGNIDDDRDYLWHTPVQMPKPDPATRGWARVPAVRVPADTREALHTRETQAGGSDEGDGGGVLTICGDQLGDVALIETVVQAPPTLRARSRGTGVDPAWGDGSRPSGVPCND